MKPALVFTEKTEGLRTEKKNLIRELYISMGFTVLDNPTCSSVLYLFNPLIYNNGLRATK